MHVVIFEGMWWTQFAPLCLNRPVFMLQSGMSTLFEKQLRHFQPSRLTLWVRPELEESCRARILPKLPMPADINTPLDDAPALLVNGRSLHLRKYPVPTEKDEEHVVQDAQGLMHAAFVKNRKGLGPDGPMKRTDRWMSIHDLPTREPQARLCEQLSDLISWNEESLIEDSTQLHGKPKPKPEGPYHFVNPDDIWLGQGAKLEPGCVLDASQGPIVLADAVRVGANAVVYGPCYIGPHSIIHPLTLIRGGTSVGRLCRLGGEVINSIVMGHSNKAHYGFLGHSYVGKWVNFGAGASTSNMKNTYGSVNIHVGNQQVPTGRQFFGSLIGDHVKLAIGTRLMTGSYVGFCSMLAGSGLPPNFVPSFSFWTDKGMEPYRIDKAVQVMKTAYARRDLKWTEADDRILAHVRAVLPEVEK